MSQGQAAWLHVLVGSGGGADEKACMNVYMLRGLHDCCGYGPTAVDMGPEGATTGNTAVPYGLRCPWLTIDNK